VPHGSYRVMMLNLHEISRTLALVVQLSGLAEEGPRHFHSVREATQHFRSVRRASGFLQVAMLSIWSGKRDGNVNRERDVFHARREHGHNLDRAQFECLNLFNAFFSFSTVDLRSRSPRLAAIRTGTRASSRAARSWTDPFGADD